MQDENALDEQLYVTVRGPLPAELHRKLRAQLILAGETWEDWLYRKAMEDVHPEIAQHLDDIAIPR